MRRVLVSLVSDQTIPNVEFIREMGYEIDAYLFISTNAMEQNGNRQWILNAAGLDERKLLEPIIVSEFSFEDIEEKLSHAINDDDTYIVNLTGGTKVMSLAVFEFFKAVNSEMYYLTGRGEKIKLHPGRKKIKSVLNVHISLSDYLTSYGFNIKNRGEPLCSKEMSETILSYFLFEFNKEKDIPVLELLRNSRSKDLRNYNTHDELLSFLQRIGFKPKNESKLSKYECRYLSGDWLEEYMFYFIKEYFDVPESAIGLSLSVDKSGTPNEFDVLVMKNNKIFLFECKTSIYIDSDEIQTFIGETIYKSDSLRNKFGLFAQTTVVTLSDLANPRLQPHLERADASKVKLIGKSSFINGALLDDLKKI